MAKFYLVETKTGDQLIVFSHTSSIVRNPKDHEEILAHPTGGEAIINAKIVRELG
ncbi:hypothetical protein JXA56_04245 [Candidatus Micrarchaeota archaeon]|nr:hypothetical protein [Candidatus Micrarchaeota archaeon]